MRYLLWGAAAALAAVSSTAAGERAWYISLEAGMSDTGAGGGFVVADPMFVLDFPLGDIDESITPIVAVGVYLGDWRLETEVAHRSGDAFNSQINQTSLMLNVAYDIPVLDRLAVTLGAGLGVDFISMDTPVADAEGMSFAYQGLVALSFELTDSTDITLTYRHFDTLEADFSESTAAGSARLSSADDSTISLGLRFAL
jgi:opacity protein-like surface antigen